MTLSGPLRPDLSVNPIFTRAPVQIPRDRFPAAELDPEVAYQVVHDELMLDGNPRLNLATFVTTWMEPQADRLMAEGRDKNLVDKDEYPHTADLESRCVRMLADLWGAPNADAAPGTSTTGSSEACMLGGLALKRRWRNARRAAGKPIDRPNMVMGINVQVCWEKFANYWDVEPRLVPMEGERFHLSAEEAAARCDDNTIGVVTILGSTFDGSYEPVLDICTALDHLHERTGWDIPVHVDAASGTCPEGARDVDDDVDDRVDGEALERPGGAVAKSGPTGLVFDEDPPWLWALAAAVPLGTVLTLGMYCFTTPGFSGWAAMGAGMGVSLAVAAVGVLLGFVFGIPRSQIEQAGVRPESAGNYRPNTNLEQISDWLTKVLVGVGLVQLANAGGPTRRLIGSVGEGLGGTPSARVVAGSVMVLSLIWGFMLSYLLTRTRVARAFRQSDLEVLTRRAATIATRTVKQQLDEQAVTDAMALTVVDKALNPAPGLPPMSQDELDTALRLASPAVRVQVFHRAREQRRVNARTAKDRVASTVPVFRALVAADTDRRYHRSHAQLGYALKDQQEPDWRGAEEILSAAIAIRGPSTRAWLLYEYNRARCRINLDLSLGVSDPQVRDAILGDLRLAARSPQLFAMLQKEEDILAWLARNNVETADVAGASRAALAPS
jgi:hypothetical protein